MIEVEGREGEKQQEAEYRGQNLRTGITEAGMTEVAVFRAATGAVVIAAEKMRENRETTLIESCSIDSVIIVLSIFMIIWLLCVGERLCLM